MGRLALPADVGPGPTKPEIRAVVLQKLGLEPGDHFVDVGAGTGAVSISAGQRVGTVTAIERDPDRADAFRTNLEANDVPAEIDLRVGDAPDLLPDAADAVFIGGTRRYEAVLDEIRSMGVSRVVLNAARLQMAGRAIEAFRERDLLVEVLSVQIGRGYDLAGQTGLRSDNPVFVIVGSTTREGDQEGEIES